MFARLTPTALACLLAAAASAADTDRTKMTPAELFTKADKDGDGELTLAEMTAAPDAVPWWKLSRKTPAEFFRAADADKNGSLSPDEFGTVDPHENHADAHFQKFDKDADGG